MIGAPGIGQSRGILSAAAEKASDVILIVDAGVCLPTKAAERACRDPGPSDGE